MCLSTTLYTLKRLMKDIFTLDPISNFLTIPYPMMMSDAYINYINYPVHSEEMKGKCKFSTVPPPVYQDTQRIAFHWVLL